MPWSIQDIMALTDAATYRKSRGLSQPHYWRTVQGNEDYLWGECRLREPYYTRTIVDLKNKRFQCSCRKKVPPCAHAIALLLHAVQTPDRTLVTYELPRWVQNWVKGPTPPSLSRTHVQVLARERVADPRWQRMSAGLEDLQRWLEDRIQQGMAELATQTEDYWEQLARRLQDAQLGGLARQVREWPPWMLLPDWPERLLAAFGRFYQYTQAWQQWEQLRETERHDLLTILGVNWKKEQVLAEPAVQDQWVLWSIDEGMEEKLRFRRSWLRGINTGQYALILDFAWQREPLPALQPLGSTWEGGLSFFPSGYPQRALLQGGQWVRRGQDLPEPLTDFTAVQDLFRAARTQHPWLVHLPIWIAAKLQLIPHPQLLDQSGQVMALSQGDHWNLAALATDQSIPLFGTWDGRAFRPLTAVRDGLLIRLSD